MTLPPSHTTAMHLYDLQVDITPRYVEARVQNDTLHANVGFHRGSEKHLALGLAELVARGFVEAHTLQLAVDQAFQYLRARPPLAETDHDAAPVMLYRRTHTTAERVYISIHTTPTTTHRGITSETVNTVVQFRRGSDKYLALVLAEVIEHGSVREAVLRSALDQATAYLRDRTQTTEKARD